MYVALEDITGKIPLPFLTDALDDDGDGSADDGILDQIITTACNDVDGFLAGIFSTPFVDPAPSQVRSAALILVCEAIYARRLTPGDRNPFAGQANAWRDRLTKIGNRELPLDAGAEGAPVAAAAAGSRPPIASRFPLWLAFLFLAGSLRAASVVNGNVGDSYGIASATNVLITPMTTPMVYNHRTVYTQATNVTPNAAGDISVNLIPGDYRVQIGKLLSDSFLINVAADSNIYRLEEIIISKLKYASTATPAGPQGIPGTNGLNGTNGLDGAGATLDITQFNASSIKNGAVMTNVSITDVTLKGSTTFNQIQNGIDPSDNATLNSLTLEANFSSDNGAFVSDGLGNVNATSFFGAHSGDGSGLYNLPSTGTFATFNPLSDLTTNFVRNKVGVQRATPAAGSTITLTNITGSGVTSLIWLVIEDNDAAWNDRLQVFVDGEAIPDIDADLGTLFLTGLDAHTGTGGAFTTKYMVCNPYGSGRSGAMSGGIKYPVPFTNGLTVKLVAPAGGTAAGGGLGLYYQIAYTPNITNNFRLRSVAVPYITPLIFTTSQQIQFFDLTNAAGSLVWSSFAAKGALNNSYLERVWWYAIDGESHTPDGNGVITTAFSTSGGEDLFLNGWYFGGLQQMNSTCALLTSGNGGSNTTVAGFDFLSAYGGLKFTNELIAGWSLKPGGYITTGGTMSYCYLYYEDTTVPYTPSAPGISGVVGNSSVTLAITNPVSQGSSPITAYYGHISPGSMTFHPGVGSNTIVVTGLTNGTAYTFTLAASNAVGLGAMSASITKTPITLPSSGSLVDVFTPGTTRSDFSSSLGFEFVPQTNMTVTDLGRWVYSGNSGSHTVGIYDVSCSGYGTTVSINTSGAPVGFKYAHLGTPISLVAGTHYKLFSAETDSGDVWSNDNATYTIATAAYFVGVAPGYTSGCTSSGTGANHQFVGVDLKYTVP